MFKSIEQEGGGRERLVLFKKWNISFKLICFLCLFFARLDRPFSSFVITFSCLSSQNENRLSWWIVPMTCPTRWSSTSRRTTSASESSPFVCTHFFSYVSIFRSILLILHEIFKPNPQKFPKFQFRKKYFLIFWRETGWRRKWTRSRSRRRFLLCSSRLLVRKKLKIWRQRVKFYSKFMFFNWKSYLFRF